MRKSLIITTNLEFGKWISIFMDKKLTSAIIDRIIHHGHVIFLQETVMNKEFNYK